jgi:hypothetical protein
MHKGSKSIKEFFEGVMWVTDCLGSVTHANSPVGLPWLWLLLPLLFLVSWGLRWRHATIWLVLLGAWVGSEVGVNILKVYFNRPRPEVLWLHTAPNSGFWQPLGQ